MTQVLEKSAAVTARAEQPPMRSDLPLRIAVPLMVLVLFVVIWHVGVQISGVPQYILPGPAAVVQAMVKGVCGRFCGCRFGLGVSAFGSTIPLEYPDTICGADFIVSFGLNNLRRHFIHFVAQPSRTYHLPRPSGTYGAGAALC